MRRRLLTACLVLTGPSLVLIADDSGPSLTARAGRPHPEESS